MQQRTKPRKDDPDALSKTDEARESPKYGTESGHEDYPYWMSK